MPHPLPSVDYRGATLRPRKTGSQRNGTMRIVKLLFIVSVQANITNRSPRNKEIEKFQEKKYKIISFFSLAKMSDFWL